MAVCVNCKNCGIICDKCGGCANDGNLGMVVWVTGTNENREPESCPETYCAECFDRLCLSIERLADEKGWSRQEAAEYLDISDKNQTIDTIIEHIDYLTE